MPDKAEWRQPRGAKALIALLFTVCPILFFTDVTRNPYYTQITLLNIFICLYWILWLKEAWTRREWIWLRTPLDLPIGALAAVCFISWFVALATHPSFAPPIYSEGSRAAVFLIINTLLVFGMAVRAQDRGFVVQWLWVVYLVASVAAGYALLQYFGIELIWPHTLNPYGNRPVSTFGNPNFMSSYLVLILPLLLADLVDRITSVPRAFVLGAFILCWSALLATLTRSSWVGGLVAMAFVAPTLIAKVRAQPAARRTVFAVLILFVLGTVLWPKGAGDYAPGVFQRLGEVRHMSEGNLAAASQRVLIWLCAWEMVQLHPVLGNGWGCFELFYPFYQGPHLLDGVFRVLRTHANNAHDEILEYWSQIGTVGLGIVALLWLTFFWVSASLGKRHEGRWRALHWGLVGGVAGMLVDNLLNVSIHFAVPAFTFWWCVGTVFALDPEARLPRRFALESPLRRGLLVAGILCLTGFSARAACLWMEEVHFFKGFKLSKGGYDLHAAQAELEDAYFWHNLEVNNNYELANVYARTGQQQKSLWMYQRALDANAGYDEIYFNRATVAMQLGESQQAIANYRMALGINPLSHDAYNALGGIYMKDFKRYGDQAEQIYELGTKAFPQDKDLWNNLGYVYTQREKWPQAFEAYHQALSIDPDFELAQRNLRTIAPHVAGSDKDIFLNQAAAYDEIDRLMKEKQWTQALSRLQPLMAAMPKNFRNHFYAGNAYFSLSQFDKAADEYRQASALKPDGAPIWQNLAISEERLGHRDQALDAYNHLLQLDPKNDALRRHIEELHR